MHGFQINVEIVTDHDQIRKLNKQKYFLKIFLE